MQIQIRTGNQIQWIAAVVAATGLIKTTSDKAEARNFYEMSGKRTLKMARKLFLKSEVEAVEVPHAPRGRAVAELPRKVGRPKGSKNKVRRGRPPGSKNKIGRPPMKRGPGRPKGSKNKIGRPPGSKTRIGKRHGYSIHGKKLGRPKGSTNKPKAVRTAKKVAKAVKKLAKVVKAAPVKKAAKKVAKAPKVAATAAPAAPTISIVAPTAAAAK